MDGQTPNDTKRGYKVLPASLQCFDKQYTVGEVVDSGVPTVSLKLGESGLHFCDSLDGIAYWQNSMNDRFFEVEAYGVGDCDAKGNCVCRAMKLLKELDVTQVLSGLKTDDSSAEYLAEESCKTCQDD